MAVAPNSTRPATVNPRTGRLLPLSDDERKARLEALDRFLAQVPEADLADETDSRETWDTVFRGIDEGRPNRSLFEGCD